MKLISKTLIYGGVLMVLLGSMVVDETYAPMTNEEFMFQIMMFIFGMGFTFVGILMHNMDE